MNNLAINRQNQQGLIRTPLQLQVLELFLFWEGAPNTNIYEYLVRYADRLASTYVLFLLHLVTYHEPFIKYQKSK